MLKYLRKIKKERSEDNQAFAIYYTTTAINGGDQWHYTVHDPRQINANQLSLVKRHRKVGNNTRFTFTVYEKTDDTGYSPNDNKKLEVLYDHHYSQVFGTLYYDKTISDIRKEKIKEVLKPDEITGLLDNS